jgi:hypothetical protein
MLKILKTLLAFCILLLSSNFIYSQSKTEAVESRKVSIYALRLTPGRDLRVELERFVKERNIDAAYIVTAVGSLQAAKIRFADKENGTAFDGKFEIVSLVGTVSQNGSHLHISISDGTGKTIGGHLVEGCKIYTTAEIIIGVAEDLTFTRETDSQTTYKELKIRRKRRS